MPPASALEPAVLRDTFLAADPPLADVAALCQNSSEMLSLFEDSSSCPAYVDEVDVQRDTRASSIVKRGWMLQLRTTGACAQRVRLHEQAHGFRYDLCANMLSCEHVCLAVGSAMHRPRATTRVLDHVHSLHPHQTLATPAPAPSSPRSLLGRSGLTRHSLPLAVSSHPCIFWPVLSTPCHQ